jgi:hypothetical protein
MYSTLTHHSQSHSLFFTFYLTFYLTDTADDSREKYALLFDRQSAAVHHLKEKKRKDTGWL